VNFLTDKNKCLLRKISDYVREEDLNSEADFELEDKDTAVTLSEGLEVDETSHLPLLIKKYHKGKLTKKLSYLEHHSLELSAERGLGLELAELPAGRLVIMAGGTGLFPFCDLIDLLFKDEVLRSASPPLAQ
jgi:nucleoid-associated protein YejK